MDSARAADTEPPAHTTASPEPRAVVHSDENNRPAAPASPAAPHPHNTEPPAQPPQTLAATQPDPAPSVADPSTVEAAAATPPMPPRLRREARVPASPLGRFVGFAGLGASLLYGTVKDQVGSMLRYVVVLYALMGRMARLYTRHLDDFCTCSILHTSLYTHVPLHISRGASVQWRQSLRSSCGCAECGQCHTARRRSVSAEGGCSENRSNAVHSGRKRAASSGVCTCDTSEMLFYTFLYSIGKESKPFVVWILCLCSVCCLKHVL